MTIDTENWAKMPPGTALAGQPATPKADETPNSPPRVGRKSDRNPRAPVSYAQEQEEEAERNNSRQKRTRNGQRNRSSTPSEHVAERPEEDTPTSTKDRGAAKILAELTKLRKEIKVRDEQHQEELQKAKVEFSAALAGVRQELEDLRKRVASPNWAQKHARKAATRRSSGNSSPYAA
jgi:cobalamin biosynthesis protein CobT